MTGEPGHENGGHAHYRRVQHELAGAHASRITVMPQSAAIVRKNSSPCLLHHGLLSLKTLLMPMGARSGVCSSFHSDTLTPLGQPQDCRIISRVSCTYAACVTTISSSP